MATNNPISNLPPFRENAPFPPANAAGAWLTAGGTLRQLGQSLEVDKNLPEASQATIIRAIPDPWAQARTFAEAVLDGQHSMHEGAVAQWRGLLALFALADLRKVDYSLDIQALELDQEHPFDRVLRHLAPQIAIGDNAGLWLSPHIVYIQPKLGQPLPIALLNPACLVAPGRTSWQVPFDFIPWMQQGLSDPLRLTGDSALSNMQLAALEAYLKNLHDTIPYRTDRVGGALGQALKDYMDAAAKKRGASKISATVRRPVDAQLPQIYQRLALPAELEPPEDPASESECRLHLASPPDLAPLNGIILVDESLASTLGKSPRDIKAWGYKMLSELLDSPAALEAVQKEAAEHGYWIITADDLLTRRLVRLRKDPKIPGHRPEMRDLLEPIRPLTLLLDQSTTRGIEIDASERRASVTLHIRIEGDGPNGTQHAISRTYRKDAGSAPSLIDGVDWDFGQASVWPDFKSAKWPYYFARLTYPTTREQIRPQFALSREIITAAVRKAAADADPEAPSAQHALQALQAINRGGAPGEKASFFHRFQSVSGKVYEEIQISELPFDTVFYVDYHPDREDGPAGCVRLKLAEPRLNDTAIMAAVDFGSTNSVACFSGTDGDPINLKSRIVHPIMFQDPARNDEWRHISRWFYIDFLPPSDRQTPTPTVVIGRNDADPNADLWLCRNLILFQPTGGHATKGAAGERKNLQTYLGRSEFNLKWSEDPRHRAAAMDFLSQFTTMIAAEAAANGHDPGSIEWHFSVPDAMRGRRLNSFRSEIAAAQAKLSPRAKAQDLHSEGLAAARFILSGQKGAKFTQGSINAILDIGGSTTDITLWARDTLLWKGSFRLAGRAFFTDTIVHNPQILREIELGDWADLIDQAMPGRLAEESLAYVGELLFSRPALVEAFDKHWRGRLNLKPGEQLRVTALLFLAGIAHYLGLVAAKLKEEGILSDADLARPAFALCGRGAGIFNRIHDSPAADFESQVTLALQCFSSAAGVDASPRPQLFVSKQPKLEVAAGMLVDFDTIDARAGSGTAQSAYTPLGLQIEFADGSILAPDASIGQTVEAGGARGSDLATLVEFLDAFNELTGIFVDLRQGAGQGAFNEINNVVRQQVDRQKNEEGLIELNEPPFITALGALVGIMAAPEQEREKRVRVEIDG